MSARKQYIEVSLPERLRSGGICSEVMCIPGYVCPDCMGYGKIAKGAVCPACGGSGEWVAVVEVKWHARGLDEAPPG